MVNYLALLGWGPGDNRERFTLPELVERFRLEDVVPSPAFFDLKKLAAFNGDAIRALPTPEFVERSEPWLLGTVPGFEPPWPPERYDATVFERMAPVVQERVATLAEVPGYIDFLLLDDPVVDEAAWVRTMTPDVVPLLDALIATFASPTLEWRGFGRPEEDELAPLAVAVFAEGEGIGLNRRRTQAPVRLAVTGRPVGPPLFESLEVLGRDETLRRLRAARSRLS
jgi:glutamyl-tRNA synthetase